VPRAAGERQRGAVRRDLATGLQPSLRLKLVAARRLESGVVAVHHRRR
jgi:hypothetical protein